MAGQVKDWVYKKVDWAYNTGSWQWAVDVATTAELFKLFSSTTIFKDAANVYDNKFYGLVSKYDGLMIRPITGSNGYTGVMHFDLYEDDSRYKSDMEGLYGEYTLRDLVLMIFKACGLDVSEAKRTYWINQVMSLMVTMPAERSWVCNTSIRPAGGYQVSAYVDKAIVDDIIDCMRVKGMFEIREIVLEAVEANATYDFVPDVSTIEEILDSAREEMLNSEWYAANYELESEIVKGSWDYLENNMTAEFMSEAIETYATAQGIDLTDCLYSLRFVADHSGGLLYPTYRVELYYYKFKNGIYTCPEDAEREEMESDEIWTREGYRLNLHLQSSMLTGYGLIEVFWCPQWRPDPGEYVVNSSIDKYSTVYQYISVLTSYRLSSSSSERTFVYRTANYGKTLITPEGISVLPDAVKPKPSTSSSSFWPSWAGRAVTVHGYSGSNHPTYTYIPVGYGDYDYDGFTQARVQSGWIYNDNYLQKLGLSMELLPEYEPVEPDPGDDEPIRPDPDPTPDPTPEEEEPLDLSANRLFTVHTLTNAEVNALGGFLYSSTFIEAIKNMFTEPMDAIIGCFILNYGSGGTIPTGSNETLKLGSVLGTSGVTGTRVTNQTFECSFGTVTIGEFYHNVEDYAPYSSAQIFLPYIGFCDLDINEIMNSSITLKYRFDVYTGACLARLFVRKNGVLQELYNFEGNSAVHIPLTGRDFTNSVSSLITGAVGVIGGAATGNPIASVMGARSLMGSTIPTTRRSGSLSANIGVLGGQKPFILIKRPKAYNAAGYNNYYGYPSNWSVSLGDCSGYTRVKDVHLDALACTDAEREEIETLLREGVIF